MFEFKPKIFQICFYKPFFRDRYLEPLNPVARRLDLGGEDVMRTYILIDLLTSSYDDTVKFGIIADSYKVMLKFENLTLSWYSASQNQSKAAKYQLNENTIPYYWFAI